MTAAAPETVWVNVYRPLMGACGTVWASRELADQMAARNRIACVPVRVGESLGCTLFNMTREGAAG
ncbi:hypothetical protein HU230_0011645 [Bradyrhizobium quebecense]|uniref:Uncharacterized protein n=1 Tax=Bradyrhizobium quebecense TaxID=2748629 RepID=A0A973WRL7_9BRAD|nr:hypothetical protein [Bradyrhizobium quebecense]UGA46647.1 hypothetical protein HU230_0011645 [Bradyrhizobium quebecense]